MPDHLPALQLMILLLTSNHDYEKALDVTEQTLEEYPENLSLMTLKVRLQEINEGPGAALNTAKGKFLFRQNNISNNHFGLLIHRDNIVSDAYIVVAGMGDC